MPLPLSLQQALSNDNDNLSRYPKPPPQPQPSPSVPRLSSKEILRREEQIRLDAYNERNHGKFHDNNRGSKKHLFKGILKLLFKCGKAANDVGGVAGA